MWKIAWRNLWRNRTRTFISVSAIALSYGMMLAFFGINDNSYTQMMDTAETAAGGSVLVHGQGYWESMGSDVVINEPTAILEILEASPEVNLTIPRVIINGLVSSPRGNEPVRLTGIVPDKEFVLDDVSRKLTQGAFLGDTHRAPIVLSQTMVDKLRLKLGDRVVLTASTPDGEVTRALFHLDGIIGSSIAGEAEIMAYTTLEAAQRAVQMEGKLTQIGILLRDRDDQSLVATRLTASLTERFDVEVLTWQEAMPDIVGLIEMDEAMGYIYIIIIFVIVLFAIANTFMMSVMERIREYGLLNAIGLTPGRIGSLMLWESAFLATVALAIGFAIGFGVHTYVATVGLDMAEMGMGDFEMGGVAMDDMVIRSTLDPLKWALGTLAVFFVVIFSCLYPAWRATRLAPAEAMRFYE
jgi:ABC-type lipoprotein release transport system permease subunit